MTPEERDALRANFDKQIADRIKSYGWPGPLADYEGDKGMSQQAHVELDALLALQKREQERRRETAEELAASPRVDEGDSDWLDAWKRFAAVTRLRSSRFPKWDITEVTEPLKPDDERLDPENFMYDPELVAQTLTCIWCGAVQESQEALEEHEAECE